MSKILNKFDYKPIPRIETPEGRKYSINGVALPSVTTILSAVMDHSHLDDWKNKIGEVQANKIKDEAAILGTGIHQNIELYFEDKPPVGNLMAKTLSNLIIKKGLSKFSEIWASEVGLYSKGLYAGTVDCIGVLKKNNKPAIIDFKNSLRPKKLEWIESYKAQIGAYALAHNEMFNTTIDQGVIMIAIRTGEYQEFLFEGNDFQNCITLWLKKLDEYYLKLGK